MNKDIILEDLEKLYPINSFYQVGVMLTNNPKKAKKKLPKIGEWEYIGSDFFSFIFKRIK